MRLNLLSKREEIGKRFIYFVLILWISGEILLNSTIQRILFWESKDVNDAMAYIILGLLLFQIVFFQRYQINELVVICAITVPIVIATLNSSHNTMMSTWIFIVAAKYLELDKFIKKVYIVQIIMILLVIGLFLTGYIEETIIYRDSVIRHSLGFSHPNMLGVRVFQLVVCRSYLVRKNIRITDVIITLLAAYFVYRVPNSKTAYYSLIILSVFMTIHILSLMINSETVWMMNWCYVVALVVNFGSVALSVIDVNKYSVLRTIDRALSRRFSHCHSTLRFYGISIWGQNIQNIVKRHMIGRYYHFLLDNSYLSILLRYGIVVFLIFSGLYLTTMYYLIKNKQYMLVSIICMFAIYGIMENNFFSMSQNIFLITISYPIYSKVLQEEKYYPVRIRLIA